MLHRPLRRPLAAISLLALADYLLWNWSLGGNHGVLALIAGLTLVPLLIAVAWLLLQAATRFLAETARRARTQRAIRSSTARAKRSGRRTRTAPLRPATTSRSASQSRAATRAGAGEAPTQASPSSKLAA